MSALVSFIYIVYQHLSLSSSRRPYVSFEGRTGLPEPRLPGLCNLHSGEPHPTLINFRANRLQNEPQHSSNTYPTCTMTPQVEAQIASGLRSLLNNNGLGGVRVVGYEVH